MSRAERDIEQAVAACLDGDRSAFDAVVNHYQAGIYRLCLALLKEPEDARDAAADAFVNAFKALDRYDPARPFNSWLFKIASNRSLEILRRRKREREILEQEILPGEDMAVSEAADEVYLREDRQEQLAAALKHLPARYRAVLSLRYEQSFSYTRIAEILEMQVGTVGSMILRAKRHLRETVQKMETVS